MEYKREKNYNNASERISSLTYTVGIIRRMKKISMQQVEVQERKNSRKKSSAVVCSGWREEKLKKIINFSA